jgi:hypothetical protein
MLLLDVVHLPTFVSLVVIAGILAVTIVASLRADRRERPPVPGPTDPHEEAHQ